MSFIKKHGRLFLVLSVFSFGAAVSYFGDNSKTAVWSMAVLSFAFIHGYYIGYQNGKDSAKEEDNEDQNLRKNANPFICFSVDWIGCREHDLDNYWNHWRFYLFDQEFI